MAPQSTGALCTQNLLEHARYTFASESRRAGTGVIENYLAGLSDEALVEDISLKAKKQKNKKQSVKE